MNVSLTCVCHLLISDDEKKDTKDTDDLSVFEHSATRNIFIDELIEVGKQYCVFQWIFIPV